MRKKQLYLFVVTPIFIIMLVGLGLMVNSIDAKEDQTIIKDDDVIKIGIVNGYVLYKRVHYIYPQTVEVIYSDDEYEYSFGVPLDYFLVRGNVEITIQQALKEGKIKIDQLLQFDLPIHKKKIDS